MSTNDNDSVMPGEILPLPDAHGHAALLLVESLIHGLCEKSSLSIGEAVRIVERAADVQSEYVETAEGGRAAMERSHSLLLSIAASLEIDDDPGPPKPRLVR